MKDILLVDGYNVIGDWPELKPLRAGHLEEARDRLIDAMAEYQAYKGWRVIVVFDAHMVPGIGKNYQLKRVEVVYTKEHETADERIEKLVGELKNVETRVHVATSDYAEQSMTFGSGALRKSARELRHEAKLVEKGIEEQLANQKKAIHKTTLPITEEMAEIFDKWRKRDL